MLYEFVHPKKHISEVPFFHLLPDDSEQVNETHLDEFFYCIYERQEIWYNRNVLNRRKPWTKDPFMSKYKFTNVYRELDRSSQYLIHNVLVKDLPLVDVVFKTMVYRYFNKPDCFLDGHVTLPDYYNYDSTLLWEQVVNCREKYYNPWHNAYMSNLVWAKKRDVGRGLFKDFAYCEILFPVFHEQAIEVANLLKIGLPAHLLMKRLEKLPSISSFMSHELVLDFSYLNKYSPIHNVKFDENSFTNVGPGASLGIKLIFPSLKPQEQREAIEVLRDVAEHKLSELGQFKYVKWDGNQYVLCESNLSLHQIEMMLCEYSKWKKMQWGVGKQRSVFVESAR